MKVCEIISVNFANMLPHIVELGIHLSMAYTHMGTPTGHTHTGKHSYGHNHRDTYTRAYTTWDFWTINSLPPQPSTVQYNLGPQQVTNSLGYNEVLLGRPCLDSHWATTRFSLGALASAKKGIRPRSL